MCYKDPWNRCLCICAVCDKEFDERRHLWCHVRFQHKMKFKSEYIVKYGDPGVSNPKVGNLLERLCFSLNVVYFSGSV